VVESPYLNDPIEHNIVGFDICVYIVAAVGTHVRDRYPTELGVGVGVCNSHFVLNAFHASLFRLAQCKPPF
jgi:hypothetical protein